MKQLGRKERDREEGMEAERRDQAAFEALQQALATAQPPRKCRCMVVHHGGRGSGAERVMHGTSAAGAREPCGDAVGQAGVGQLRGPLAGER